MILDARRLNRATLARQLLLERESLPVPEAIRRIGGLQAQEPASPYLALWNRLADFDATELDAAFDERTVVKSSLMRLTLHAVHVEDYPAYYRAMLPSLRASRLNDRRFTTSGLSTADADALVPDLLAFLESPRTSAEAVDFVQGGLGEKNLWAWWALRTFAPLHRAPTGGPWAFEAQPAYLAAGRTPEAYDERAVQHLLLRYLRAFGPASPRDFAQFSLLRSPVVKRALAALADEIVELQGPDGATLLDLPGAPIPPKDAVAPPRLLPMWDSTLLAYADRSRVIPDAYRPLVIRRNGDVLPTLLVDGYVAGVWRPVAGGIEATAFEWLDDAAWDGLGREAVALGGFLAERDPAVYRRYANWWTKGIPGEAVRLLPT